MSDDLISCPHCDGAVDLSWWRCPRCHGRWATAGGKIVFHRCTGTEPLHLDVRPRRRRAPQWRDDKMITAFERAVGPESTLRPVDADE